MNDLAQELAWQPEITQRLLELHTADVTGRCRGCTQGGTGLPGGVWPCALHFYASAASQIAGWHGIGRANRIAADTLRPDASMLRVDDDRRRSAW